METPDLIHAAQHGNLPAFNHLISGYQDQLYTLVCWVTAGELDPDPVVHAIIASIYHDLHNFQKEEFRLWLYRAAVRECRRAIRRAHQGSRKNGQGASAQPTGAPSMEDSLRSLNLEQRLAVVLVDQEKLDYAQAARVAGVPAGKIRRHLGEARFSLLVLGKNNSAARAVPNL